MRKPVLGKDNGFNCNLSARSFTLQASPAGSPANVNMSAVPVGIFTQLCHATGALEEEQVGNMLPPPKKKKLTGGPLGKGLQLNQVEELCEKSQCCLFRIRF